MGLASAEMGRLEGAGLGGSCEHPSPLAVVQSLVWPSLKITVGLQSDRYLGITRIWMVFEAMKFLNVTLRMSIEKRWVSFQRSGH